MGIRTRTVLLAALAVVVPQLTPLERGDSPGAGMDEATPSLQLHHAPDPATETAGTSLPDVGVDRLSPSPFAAPASLDHDRSPITVRAPVARSWRPTPGTSVALPPSRAPPAHS
ncbi:MAG: hypothetical protein ACOC8B_02910 [Gemmatimonadota bacterium]